MDITTLRDLIHTCWDKVDWSIPIRDADECKRVITAIPGWTMDCAWVHTCMAADINIINNAISNNTSSISNHFLRIQNLEADSHTHANYLALQWIRNDLSANVYLGWDWDYHPMPAVAGTGHIIASNNNPVSQRLILDFSSNFAVTDDPINNTTHIEYIWSWGSTPTPDEYVNWIGFDPMTNILTLTRALGSDLTQSLASLVNTDELVKVGPLGTATYLNINDFSPNGTDIEIKKQMSIVSDTNWLMLDGDELTPPDNTVYGKKGWVKWWYPDTGNEVNLPVVWVVSQVFNHGLNKRPNIVCENTAGDWVLFDANTTDSNTTVLTFSPAFTGTIFAN